jgi:hypothetical protein
MGAKRHQFSTSWPKRSRARAARAKGFCRPLAWTACTQSARPFLCYTVDAAPIHARSSSLGLGRRQAEVRLPAL